MELRVSEQSVPPIADRRSKRDLGLIKLVLSLLFALALLSSFLVIVNAGERGVLMQFGKVQDEILGEGLHVIIPVVHTVQKLSVRVQNQEISAEASSRDLQEVYADVSLNWHIVPEEVNWGFQQIGDEQALITRIINPAVEEVLKAVMAKYTAEEIITRRGEVKAGVDDLLTIRLRPYHIQVDDISLVHAHFSDRFSDAVEAKQIAEQEAKQAEFIALRAIEEAEARVNLARGEAEAQRLLKETITAELLQKQAIEKWDGKLPIIMGSDTNKVIDLNKIIKQSMKSAQATSP